MWSRSRRRDTQRRPRRHANSVECKTAPIVFQCVHEGSQSRSVDLLPPGQLCSGSCARPVVSRFRAGLSSHHAIPILSALRGRTTLAHLSYLLLLRFGQDAVLSQQLGAVRYVTESAVGRGARVVYQKVGASNSVRCRGMYHAQYAVGDAEADGSRVRRVVLVGVGVDDFGSLMIISGGRRTSKHSDLALKAGRESHVMTHWLLTLRLQRFTLCIGELE